MRRSPVWPGSLQGLENRFEALELRMTKVNARRCACTGVSRTKVFGLRPGFEGAAITSYQEPKSRRRIVVVIAASFAVKQRQLRTSSVLVGLRRA